jgi:ferritin-like metal-binding protein YciE
MSRSEQKVLEYVKEARASELALARVLQSQIAVAPRGSHRDGLETHLEETRSQAARLKARARELDRGFHPLTLAVGVAEAVTGQALALAKTPVDLVRGGASGDEKVLKNAKDAAASEALEIATYTALERLAELAGDATTAKLAATIRAEEERMLERLLHEIPALTEAVHSSEVLGTTTFDVTKTGAADAVRDAGEALGDAAEDAAATAKKTASKAKTTAKAKADEARTAARSKVDEVESAAKAKASDAKKAAKAKVDEVESAAKAKADDAKRTTKAKADEVEKAVKAKAEDAKAAAAAQAGEAKAAAEEAASKVETAAADLKDEATDQVEAARAEAGEKASAAKATAKSATDDVKAVATQVAGDAKDAAEDVGAKVADKAEDVKDTAEAARAKAADTAKDVQSKAQDVADDAADTAKDAKAQADDAAKDTKAEDAAAAQAAAVEEHREAVEEEVSELADDLGENAPLPWPGYDELSVEGVRAVLLTADTEKAASVVAYERANKARAGVLESAGRLAHSS